VSPPEQAVANEGGGETNAVPFRARLRAAGHGPAPLRIAGWLTPYELETITMDAQRLGAGARLELTLSANASEHRLEWLRRRFATLRRRGIEVCVRRDGDRRSDRHATGPAGPPHGPRGG
jgi:hypothetical protein